MLVTLIILCVIGVSLGVYGAVAYIYAPIDWGYGFGPRYVGSDGPDEEMLAIATSVLREKNTPNGASLADEIEREQQKN